MSAQLAAASPSRADLKRANLRRKWSTIPKLRLSSNISQSAVTLHRVAAFCLPRLRLFEIAHVLVCLDHVASVIVNADHGVGFRFVSIRRLVHVSSFWIDESSNPGLYVIAFNVFSRGPTLNETFPLAAAICVPLPDNPPVGVEPSSV